MIKVNDIEIATKIEIARRMNKINARMVPMK